MEENNNPIIPASISDEAFQKHSLSEYEHIIDNPEEYLNKQPQQDNTYQNTQDVAQQQQYQEPIQQQPVGNVPQQVEQVPQENIDPAVYEEAYKRITAPFKASGKEFQVRNIDEAITLMQKGVDYTKKQQALKPRLVEMRTLERQGMLGDNLNYAIDLFNGNPQAIAKLIKDKNIDVNQLLPQTNEYGEVENKPVDNYIPYNHRISDSEVSLMEISDNLRSQGTYDSVNAIITKLDSASLEKIREQPTWLNEFSALVSSGLDKPVFQELERARTLSDPAIEGLSDIDAIGVIGARLYGKPAQQQQIPQQQQYYQQPVQQPQYQQPAYNPQAVQQANFQMQQQYMQNRKQAVAPIRGQVSRPTIQTYDPLSCSDEEFAKINIREILRN